MNSSVGSQALLTENQGTITDLLSQIAIGVQGAETELFQLVYDEIHRTAVTLMKRERRDHTLEPAALVGEVYLRLFSGSTFKAPNRKYFFGAVVRAMRCALIDHARQRDRRPQCDPLDGVLDWIADVQQVEILDLYAALDELETLHHRHYYVVTQNIFAGRTNGEIANDLGCSLSTVEKDWKFSRGWLRKRLKELTHET